MKNPKKEKQPNSFFPKINRFITESWKIILISFISGALLIAIALQSISFYHNYQEEKRLEATRGKTIAELKYWQQIAGEYKNYRDAYFKIATLEYRLGNIEEARINLKKTLDLDPNFEKAREMEKLMGS